MPETPKEKMVRVYNRGQRSFIHGEHRIVGASFAEVPASIAENWMKMFPNDVVEAGVAQKELGGVQVELAETKAKLAKAEHRIKELDAILHKKTTDPKGEKARQELAAAEAKIAELTVELEKATAPTPAPVAPAAADQV